MTTTTLTHDRAVDAGTILVVDDSPVNLRLLVRILEGKGYRLLVAKSGRAALDVAKATQPNLVLLDVMMPEMDGFEVCRALKRDPATSDVVIIFLSALGEVADKVAGLELGASDYITKPIQAEEVLARVASHLSRQQLEHEVRRSRDRLRKELASAGAMQRLILPAALPATDRVAFSSYYRTSLYAGGDYYDVLPLDDERFGIFVADVSGHGAKSAIVMAMIRAAVHAYRETACDPASLLQRINRHFEFLWETPMFATALCAVLDANASVLDIACAGHPSPLLLRGGRVSLVPCDATLPLFMMDNPVVPVARLPLERGDRMLFYTDGVTERYGPGGDEMYDLPRLISSFEGADGLPPEGLVASLVVDLELFADAREPEDDQTLLLAALDPPVDPGILTT
jgi:sigma-B regulation protein RsbU (phosphoserine phosphatase)